jgi:hypothetical protein
MALLQKGYLGATPLFRDVAWFQQHRYIAIQTAGVNVTTGGTAHTKGSWFQLIASTSANASHLMLRIDGLGLAATNTAGLLDIGFGASTAETVKIADIAIGGATANINIEIPFQIPSGTRISARAQSAATSRLFRCDPYLYDLGDYSTAPTSVDVITTDPLTSKGIEFDGASGSWTLAIASTTRAYRGVCLVPSVHDTDSANITNTLLDVGVGASGSEVSFGTYRLDWLNSETVRTQVPGYSLFGRGSVIPAGSRLSVKHNIAANPSKYGFCLIGIP